MFISNHQSSQTLVFYVISDDTMCEQINEQRSLNIIDELNQQQSDTNLPQDTIKVILNQNIRSNEKHLKICLKICSECVWFWSPIFWRFGYPITEQEWEESRQNIVIAYHRVSSDALIGKYVPVSYLHNYHMFRVIKLFLYHRNDRTRVSGKQECFDFLWVSRKLTGQLFEQQQHSGLSRTIHFSSGPSHGQIHLHISSLELKCISTR